MSINLSKGERVNLSKESPNLTQAGIGLGWDINTTDTGSAKVSSECLFHLQATCSIWR